MNKKSTRAKKSKKKTKRDHFSLQTEREEKSEVEREFSTRNWTIKKKGTFTENWKRQVEAKKTNRDER